MYITINRNNRAIVSITTTGYGDFYLYTPLGRFIGSITMLTGLLYLTMPISIISSVFEKYVIEEEARRNDWRNKLHQKDISKNGEKTIMPAQTVEPKKANLETILDEGATEPVSNNESQDIELEKGVDFKRKIMDRLESLIVQQEGFKI